MATSNLIEATENRPQVLYAGAVPQPAIATVYTVPSNHATAVATATLCNGSGSARTISISVVQSGGTASTGNRVASIDLDIGESCIIEELVGLLLGPGDFIAAGATGNSVGMVLTGAVSS